jgi:hypothetical protein
VRQSRLEESPFEFADASVKDHLTGDWREKVKERISRADRVAVICGLHTDTATGVAAEVTIAQGLNKPYFLLAGYKDKTNQKPATSLAADKMCKWTWDNIMSLIAGHR